MSGKFQTAECRDVTAAEWVSAVTAVRDEGYTFFDWLSGVDQTDDATDPAYEVVVHVVNIAGEPGDRWDGLLLRTRVPVGTAAPSLTGVFAGAAWYERETHEMFGVDFTGFDDGTGLGLRGLLLPNGFEGHPLRKSFVLTARASKPWPGAKEPGEGHDSGPPAASSRRKVSAMGVPDPSWGPRAEAPEVPEAPEAPAEVPEAPEAPAEVPEAPAAPAAPAGGEAS